MTSIRKKVLFNEEVKAKIDALIEYLGLITRTEMVNAGECGDHYCTGHLETFLILEPKKEQTEKDRVE